MAGLRDLRTPAAEGGVARTPVRDVTDSSFSRGLRYGAKQVQSSVQNAAAAAGTLVGADEFAQQQREEAAGRMEQAAPLAPRVQDPFEAESFEDLVDWAEGVVATQIPTLAATAAGGLAGAGLRQLALRSVVSAPAAAGAGAVATAMTQEAGSIYDSVESDPEAVAQSTPKERAAAALGGGAVAGSLEALPLFRLFNKSGLGKSAQRSLLGRVARHGAEQAVAEAGTEGLQTVTERAAHKLVNDHLDVFGEAGVREILSAMAAGGLVGGALGGLGGAVSTPAPQQQRTKLDDALDDIDVADEQEALAAKRAAGGEELKFALSPEGSLRMLLRGGARDPATITDDDVRLAQSLLDGSLSEALNAQFRDRARAYADAGDTAGLAELNGIVAEEVESASKQIRDSLRERVPYIDEILQLGSERFGREAEAQVFDAAAPQSDAYDDNPDDTEAGVTENPWELRPGGKSPVTYLQGTFVDVGVSQQDENARAEAEGREPRPFDASYMRRVSELNAREDGFDYEAVPLSEAMREAGASDDALRAEAQRRAAADAEAGRAVAARFAPENPAAYLDLFRVIRRQPVSADAAGFDTAGTGIASFTDEELFYGVTARDVAESDGLPRAVAPDDNNKAILRPTLRDYAAARDNGILVRANGAKGSGKLKNYDLNLPQLTARTFAKVNGKGVSFADASIDEKFSALLDGIATLQSQGIEVPALLDTAETRDEASAAKQFRSSEFDDVVLFNHHGRPVTLLEASRSGLERLQARVEAARREKERLSRLVPQLEARRSRAAPNKRAGIDAVLSDRRARLAELEKADGPIAESEQGAAAAEALIARLYRGLRARAQIEGALPIKKEIAVAAAEIGQLNAAARREVLRAVRSVEGAAATIFRWEDLRAGIAAAIRDETVGPELSSAQVETLESISAELSANTKPFGKEIGQLKEREAGYDAFIERVLKRPPHPDAGRYTLGDVNEALRSLDDSVAEVGARLGELYGVVGNSTANSSRAARTERAALGAKIAHDEFARAAQADTDTDAVRREGQPRALPRTLIGELATESVERDREAGTNRNAASPREVEGFAGAQAEEQLEGAEFNPDGGATATPEAEREVLRAKELALRFERLGEALASVSTVAQAQLELHRVLGPAWHQRLMRAAEDPALRAKMARLDTIDGVAEFALELERYARNTLPRQIQEQFSSQRFADQTTARPVDTNVDGGRGSGAGSTLGGTANPGTQPAAFIDSPRRGAPAPQRGRASAADIGPTPDEAGLRAKYEAEALDEYLRDTDGEGLKFALGSPASQAFEQTSYREVLDSIDRGDPAAGSKVRAVLAQYQKDHAALVRKQITPALKKINAALGTQYRAMSVDEAVSARIPERVLRMYRGQAQQLGLNPKDLAAFGFVAGFGGLSVPSTRGIYVAANFTDPRSTLHVLVHEVGHALQADYFTNAPQDVKAAIFEEYDDFYNAALERTPAEVMQERTGSGYHFDSYPPFWDLGDPVHQYLLSFSEWFADGVSKALTTPREGSRETTQAARRDFEAAWGAAGSSVHREAAMDVAFDSFSARASSRHSKVAKFFHGLAKQLRKLLGVPIADDTQMAPVAFEEFLDFVRGNSLLDELAAQERASMTAEGLKFALGTVDPKTEFTEKEQLQLQSALDAWGNVFDVQPRLVTRDEAFELLKKRYSSHGARAEKLALDALDSVKGFSDPASGAVYLNPSLSAEQRVHYLAHEAGHLVFAQHWNRTENKDRKAIEADYKAWRDAQGGTVGELLESKTGLAELLADQRPLSTLSKKEREYYLGFEEWFVDQVGAHLTSGQSRAPKPGTVARFFYDVAQSLRKLFGAVKNSGYKAADSVAQFVDNIAARHDVDGAHRLFAEATERVAVAPKDKDVREQVKVTAKQLAAFLTNRYPFDMAGFIGARVTFGRLPPEQRRVLGNAFMHGATRNQLRAKAPHIDFESYDPLDIAALGYQLWLAGDMDLGPKTLDVFNNVRSAQDAALGTLSDETQTQSIFEQLSAVGATVAAKSKGPWLINPAARQPRFKRVAKAAKVYNEYIGPFMNAGFSSALSRLQAFENPYITQLVRLVYAEAGSAGVGTSLMEARTRQIGEYANRVSILFQNESVETADAVVAAMRKWHDTGKAPKKGTAVGKLAHQLRAVFDAMFKYAQEAGVPVAYQESYFPRAWDVDALGQDREAFIKMVSQKKYQKHLVGAVTEFEELATTLAEAASVKRAHFEIRKVLGPKWRQRLFDEAVKDGVIVNASLRNAIRDTDTMDGVKALAEALAAHGRNVASNRVRAAAEKLHYKLTRNLDPDKENLKNPDQIAHNPFFAAMDEKSLRWIEELDAAPFLHSNLGDIMMNYVHQVVTRAEFARRFGDEGARIGELLDRARGAGATDEQITATANFVRSVQGTLGVEFDRQSSEWADKYIRKASTLPGIGKAIAKLEGKVSMSSTNALLITYQNIRLLAFATLSSLVDPLGITMRGGVSAGFVALRTGFAEVHNMVKGDRSKTRQLADALGLVNEALTNQALQWEYGSSYMTGGVRKANNTFFKWIGLSKWTELTRLMALSAAQSFLADQVTSPSEHSARWLTELNLDASDIKVDGDGRLTVMTREDRAAATPEEVARDDRVRAALVRWVDQAILRPNAATRPIWSSHPAFALIFHLKAYIYSFQETYLRRVWNETQHGNYGPAMALSSFVPAMIAIDLLRDMLQNGGEPPEYKEGWDWQDYAWEATQRSGVLGVSSLTADVQSALAHGGSGLLALSGPTAQQGSDVLEAMFNNHSDPETAVEALPAQNVYKRWFL